MSEALIIRKRLLLPSPSGAAGHGAAAAGRLDAALVSVGFTLSGRLLEVLSRLAPDTVVDVGQRLLAVVREMVGDHVRHNVYFRDFPANVPDTVEFWASCVRDALGDPERRELVLAQLSTGVVNLLDLPRYGRYRHTYEEMVAAHEELVPFLSDRLTVIGLGDTLAAEEQRLYLDLAASAVPLAPDDLAAVAELARACADGPQPDEVPMRESRAVVNRVWLERGGPLLVDTVTDVLRLACAMSDGDVSLAEPTRFRSFRRTERRALLAALDGVVASGPARLTDVSKQPERWKRLGERLHPHEYAERFPHAYQVFEVARGDRRAPSLAARVEDAYTRGDVAALLDLYRVAPGMLFRGVDRLLRLAVSTGTDADVVVSAVESLAGAVAGRVVLGTREHLMNRGPDTHGRRIFVNRAGRAWATPDERAALADDVVERLLAVLDAEIARRLPTVDHLVVDRDVLGVALPLSARPVPAGGVGLLPRGSVTRVDGHLLRFFVYWRETARTTDFDLSALLLDAAFENPTWLSYTNLTTLGGRHSGDITEAPDGASEFIDLDLDVLPSAVVVPQVNIYSGEGFDDVAESFFGFMNRDAEQRGRPFEPATVRMKSDLRGPSRVALPLAFVRGDDGTWTAHWLHLFLHGRAVFNRVEDNKVSTAELARGILGRRHLTVGYLVELLRPRRLTVVEPGQPRPDGDHTYLGPESIDELRALVPT